MTDFYEDSGAPTTGSQGSSATMRAEFQSIEAGFAKVAQYTGNANNVVVINSGGSAQTTLDESGFKAQFSLEVGVDVQAYSADLDAIAGLTSAANRLPYFDGSESAALATFTSAGRALLDDADAAAQLITLGLSATATELNYVDGVTSAIQDQLDSKVGETHTGNVAITGDLEVDSGSGLERVLTLSDRPQLVSVSSSRNFATSDFGMGVRSTSSGDTYTLIAGIGWDGGMISFATDGNSSTIGVSGVTLSWLQGGVRDVGSRSIAERSSVTLRRVSSTEYEIWGNGIS